MAMKDPHWSLGVQEKKFFANTSCWCQAVNESMHIKGKIEFKCPAWLKSCLEVMAVEKIKITPMKEKQQIWNRSPTQSHHVLVIWSWLSLLQIQGSTSELQQKLHLLGEREVYLKKILNCILYGIYIWNEFSAEAEKATALPDRSSQGNCGSEQFHTRVHLHNGAILGADKVHRVNT